MTRKKYEGKLAVLIIAIHKDCEGMYSDDTPWKLGTSLKYVRDHSHEVIEKFGSYQAAWDALKACREYYGVS